MLKFPMAQVPDFLDTARRPSDSQAAEDRRLVQQELGGDPSRFKLNHVIVMDQTLQQIANCLAATSHGIEYVKLYSGSYADRIDEVPDLVAVCKQYGVIPYIGGGVAEKAIRTGTLARFTTQLARFGIDTIELSNSYGDIPAARAAQEIARVRQDFERVLIEIGSKSSGTYQSISEWERDYDVAREADPTAIILEGTGAGRSGIYSSSGRENSVLVSRLLERAGSDASRILVEAPYHIQRQYWINEMFGHSVRLGNIDMSTIELQSTDRLRLDAMRVEQKEAVRQNRQMHQEITQELEEICAEEGIPIDTIAFADALHGFSAEKFIQLPNWRQVLRREIHNFCRPNRHSTMVTISPQHLAMVLRMYGFEVM